MSTPQDAPVYNLVLDPSDETPFGAIFRRGLDIHSPLLPDENIFSLGIAPAPAAYSAGLRVAESAGRLPTAAGNEVGFWLSVIPAMRASEIFSDAGLLAAIEFTLVTDHVPPRTIQHSACVHVRQK